VGLNDFLYQEDSVRYYPRKLFYNFSK